MACPRGPDLPGDCGEVEPELTLLRSDLPFRLFQVLVDTRMCGGSKDGASVCERGCLCPAVFGTPAIVAAVFVANCLGDEGHDEGMGKVPAVSGGRLGGLD